MADQLAGTRQAANKHRTDAALWGAQTSAGLENAAPLDFTETPQSWPLSLPPNRRRSRPRNGWLPTMPKHSPKMPHRPVTDENELAETADERAQDQREAGPMGPAPEGAGSTLPDVREEAAKDADGNRGSGQVDRTDAVRVPTADETAESARRAQRASAELKHRQAAEVRRGEDDARYEASRSNPALSQQFSEQNPLIESTSR